MSVMKSLVQFFSLTVNYSGIDECWNCGEELDEAPPCLCPECGFPN
jgi:hypothetical protein